MKKMNTKLRHCHVCTELILLLLGAGLKYCCLEPPLVRLALWPAQGWCNLRGRGRGSATVHCVHHALMWQTMVTWRAATTICKMSKLQACISWKPCCSGLPWPLMPFSAVRLLSFACQIIHFFDLPKSGFKGGQQFFLKYFVLALPFTYCYLCMTALCKPNQLEYHQQMIQTHEDSWLTTSHEGN